jgi:hypothetical protein
MSASTWRTIAAVFLVICGLAVAGAIRYFNTPSTSIEGQLVVRQVETAPGGFAYSVSAGPARLLAASTPPGTSLATFVASRTVILPYKDLHALPYSAALNLASRSAASLQWRAFRVDVFRGNRLKIYLRRP